VPDDIRQWNDLTQCDTCGTMYKRPALAAHECGAEQGSEVDGTSNRWTCPFKYSRIVNYETGEVRALDCRRWACVEHGPKLAWRWRQRVGMVPWRLMLTLTLVPENQEAARKAWTAMARWLRSKGMRTYLRVMELGGENGMRHWHVLVDCDRVEQDELSRKAASVGLGYVVWVSRVRSRIGAVWYLLGYVFKSLGVHDGRQRGWRKLTVSRNIPSWPTVLKARADYVPGSIGDRWVVVGGSSRDDAFDPAWADRLKGAQLGTFLEGGDRVGETDGTELATNPAGEAG